MNYIIQKRYHPRYRDMNGYLDYLRLQEDFIQPSKVTNGEDNFAKTMLTRYKRVNL